MNFPSSKRILATGVLAVFAVWLAYALIGFNRQDVGQWGEWGDGFGALNALFTGIGLVGILATLAHQQEEVKEAKADLNQVLAALGSTARAMERQAKESLDLRHVQALQANISAKEMLLGQSNPAGVRFDYKQTLRTELQVHVEELGKLLELARKNASEEREWEEAQRMIERNALK